MKEFISKSVKDTYNIAKKISAKLNSGDIVLLSGDLGAGKTHFVKGIVKSFGGDDKSVTSPTFTIINEYLTNKFNIYHFDLYRIDNPNELYNIGFEEYFYGDGVCFIEWPERAEEFFIGDKKIVNITKIDDNARKFIIEGIDLWKC